MAKNKINYKVIGIIALLLLLVSGLYLYNNTNLSSSSGGLTYNYNSDDTLLSTGYMNLKEETGNNGGTEFTLTKDIPPSDNVKSFQLSDNKFVNTSGNVKVTIKQDPKKCNYVVSRAYQSGNVGVDILRAFEIYQIGNPTQSADYQVSVNTPNGNVIGTKKYNPFGAVYDRIPLPTNPDNPTQQNYLQVTSADASQGSQDCIQNSGFYILATHNTVIPIKKEAYDSLTSSCKFDLLGAFTFTLSNDIMCYAQLSNVLNDPNSRFSSYNVKGLDNVYNVISQQHGNSQIYYENSNLGNAIVKIGVPLWAYDTIVYEKIPKGLAQQVGTCTLQDSYTGRTTYGTFTYTNVGDTSTFYYSVSGPDYSVSGLGNSGVAVQNGQSKTENFEAVPNKIGDLSLIINVKGGLGNTVPITCTGKGVDKNIAIDQPVSPNVCPTSFAIESGGMCICKDNGTPYNSSKGCPGQYLSCPAFIMKKHVDTINSQLSVSSLLFGAGEPTILQSCDWDYWFFGLVLFALSVIIYLYGIKEKNEQTSKIGLALGAVSGIILVLSFISSNALSILLGGFGIVLIIVAAIIVKFLLL